MSRTLKAAYVATLFASAQEFNAKQLENVEKLRDVKDPTDILLEVLREAPAGSIPSLALEAAEALAATRILRIDATVAVIKGQQQAVQRAVEGLAETLADDPDSDVSVGDGMFDEVTEDTIAGLETVHKAIEAGAKAEALMASVRAQTPLAASAYDFGQTHGAGSVVLQ